MEPMQIEDEMYLGIEAELGLSGSPVSPAEEIMPGVRPLWYGELAKLDIPPPTWVVDKLVPAQSITIVSAAPEQFKTWLVLDIAINVARGNALFGHFEIKQTNVLIVDDESGPGRLRERLQMLGVTDEIPIAIATYEQFKLSEESAGLTVRFCMAHGIGLVVFDSLTRLHSGDENSAKDMSIVMGNLKTLVQEGIAVIVIHHNRKPGQFGGGGANEMRGSGDLLAACDVQISVKRKPNSDIITVSQNKNRDAPHLAPFDLKVSSDNDRLWFEYIGTAPKRIVGDELVDEAILALLKERGRLFQGEVIEALQNIAGEKKITDRLAELDATEDKLDCTKGAHGRKYYGLKAEQFSE